jgi:hypothetical protein
MASSLALGASSFALGFASGKQAVARFEIPFLQERINESAFASLTSSL